jgi:hypothetical protein
MFMEMRLTAIGKLAQMPQLGSSRAKIRTQVD